MSVTLNMETAEEVVEVYVPITDLLGCRGAYVCPSVLTYESQQEIASKVDPRILEQILRYYVRVSPTEKHLKPTLKNRLIKK